MNEVKPPFISRVVLRDYRSIRHCDVTLEPLTLLVGLNGSGKTNFLDALRFIADSLRTNLQNAVDERGGVWEIVRQGKDNCNRFSIELTAELPSQRNAGFEVIVGEKQGLFFVEKECCWITRPDGGKFGYCLHEGQVRSLSPVSNIGMPPFPPVRDDQLYLPSFAGFPGVDEFVDHLRGMRFYNIDPEQIRNLSSSRKPVRDLTWRGEGAAYTLQRLLFKNPKTVARLEEYLQHILPVAIVPRVKTSNTTLSKRGTVLTEGQGIEHFSGDPESLAFVLDVGGEDLTFAPRNISDGTLRAFGVLLALFQTIDRDPRDPIPLVGIEEPEASLHPAAAGVLWDAMNEASHFTQVLATTHSAELLDRKDVNPDSLRVVEMLDGETRIAPVDEAGQSLMRERLATAGELLAQNQLSSTAATAIHP